MQLLQRVRRASSVIVLILDIVDMRATCALQFEKDGVVISHDSEARRIRVNITANDGMTPCVHGNMYVHVCIYIRIYKVSLFPMAMRHAKRL